MIVKNLQTTCTHCGLPVPAGLIEAGQEEQFCCHGCDAAYRLIHANGLDSFYRMLDASTDRNALRRDVEKRERFDEFDEPVFRDKYVVRNGASQCQTSLSIEGIHCAACIWLIEKLPRILPGVIDAQVNWAKGTVRVQWDDEQARLSQIATTLDRLGYTPEPIVQSRAEQKRLRENRVHLVRIGIAAAAAGNNMLIAASLYLGMYSFMSPGTMQLLRVASCVVGLAALIWPGRVFLSGAWNAIRTRTPHMDLPIALALFVGTVAGLVNTVRGTGEIYFDSLSVLIFLLLLGRWIQFRQQNRAANAVELLHRLIPARARKLMGDQIVETYVDLIQPGDLLEIRPHDLLPVDAVVVNGESKLDESILTGESRPVSKNIGDNVLAGTRNCDSRLVVRATATGGETRLSGIVDLVEQASLDKPKIVQWANQVGGYFVGAVVILAVITFCWWCSTDVSAAVERTVALLIVACPCALAIATPLALSVAIGRAARNRIIVKSGDVMQFLNRPGMVWLDKTGTVTTGQLEVVKWYGETGDVLDIANLERDSSHPVAAAIIEFAERFSESDPDGELPMKVADMARDSVTAASELPGMGITGQVRGRKIAVGCEALLEDQGIDIAGPWRSIVDEIVQAGFSPCWIAIDETVTAIAAIGDSIRPEAGQAIGQLKRLGWQVGMLSGDHESIVSQVAGRLDIDPEDVHGAVVPETKLKIVQESLDRFETVVMVGDGVNDSAALAAASVGIAVHNGAEASLAAAPVYLAEEGLNPILKLFSISASTGRTMRRNLAVSLIYNILGATLAFAGWINPLVAAILMPASSLTVVALSLSAGATRR